MTSGQTSVVGMFAVAAILLALNLIVSGSPRVLAQGPDIRILPEPPVTAVALISTDTRHIYRLWSDGTVELNIVTNIASGCFQFGWCGWQVVPNTMFP